MITGEVGLPQLWAEWMAGGDMSPRTIVERVQLVARFETAAECSSLDATWRDLSAFLANKEFQRGTKVTYHASLCTWFQWLLLMGYRADDPSRLIRAPKPPRRKPRPVSLDNLNRIFATRMHHRTRGMVLLGAYEGFRVSEIARIRGDDLDGDTIRVQGKGDRVDYLPVHPLVAQIAETFPRRGYWFPSHTRPGAPIHGKSVSNIVGKLMRRAGVNATPHALRHFFGTECLRASGGNLETVRQLMRHENIATTTRYTEIDETARRLVVAALPLADVHLDAPDDDLPVGMAA